MSLHFTTLATSFAVGVAVGQMRTCRDLRDAVPMLDTDTDGTPDFGHAASGFERLIEPYYRWHVCDKFEASPDWQYICRPAGNGDKTMNLIGFAPRPFSDRNRRAQRIAEHSRHDKRGQTT